MQKQDEVSDAQQRGNYRLVANEAAMLRLEKGSDCTSQDVEDLLDRPNKHYLRDMPDAAFLLAVFCGFDLAITAIDNQGEAPCPNINFMRKRKDEGMLYSEALRAVKEA